MLEYDVGDCCENELDKPSVSGAGEVSAEVGLHTVGIEPLRDVLYRGVEVVGACVLLETRGQRIAPELFSEIEGEKRS